RRRRVFDRAARQRQQQGLHGRGRLPAPRRRSLGSIARLSLLDIEPAHPANPDVTLETMPSLTVDLAPGHKTGLLLRNPVMTASGTSRWGVELSKQLPVERLGALLSKGVTMVSRAGNPQPRVAQTPAGMLNSIGLQNVGIEKTIDELAPLWARWDV